MISGFLTSVISSLRPRQHIEERLTLIISFPDLLSGAAAAFRQQLIGQYRAADKHARYISEIAT